MSIEFRIGRFFKRTESQIRANPERPSRTLGNQEGVTRLSSEKLMVEVSRHATDTGNVVMAEVGKSGKVKITEFKSP